MICIGTDHQPFVRSPTLIDEWTCLLNIPDCFPEETDGEQDNTGDIPSSTE
jgi:hypothetical protein